MCVTEQWYHIRQNGSRELRERHYPCDQRNLINHHPEIRTLADTMEVEIVEISPRANKEKSRRSKNDTPTERSQDKGKGKVKLFGMFSVRFSPSKKKKDEKTKITVGRSDKKVAAPAPSRPSYERRPQPYAHPPEPSSSSMRRRFREFEWDSRPWRTPPRAPSPDVIVVEPNNLRDDFRLHAGNPPSPSLRIPLRVHIRRGSRGQTSPTMHPSPNQRRSSQSPRTPIINERLQKIDAELRDLRREASSRNRAAPTNNAQRVHRRQEQEHQAGVRHGRSRRGSESHPGQAGETRRRSRSRSHSRESETTPRRRRARSCDSVETGRPRSYSRDQIPSPRRSEPCITVESPRVRFDIGRSQRVAADRDRPITMIHQDFPPTRNEDFGVRGDRVIERAVRAEEANAQPREPVGILRRRSERRVWEDDPHRDKERYI